MFQGLEKEAKPATLLKVTLPHGRFSHFLNCTNDTKTGEASHALEKPYRSGGTRKGVDSNESKIVH